MRRPDFSSSSLPAEPRYATRRRPERKSDGHLVAAVARQLYGYDLMPWQQHILDVAREINPDTGNYAYREVIVTLPRQQGKTTLVLSNEVDVCLRHKRAHVAYTAQNGQAARKKLLLDHAPTVTDSALGPLVSNVVMAAGSEAIEFKNGSRIAVVGGAQSAGHGSVLDLATFDEAFDDVDDRREQAMLPAMLTKPDAQMWVVSTQGDEGSLYLNRKCELGREAAGVDSGTGVAYFEWSAEPGAEPGDPDTWRSCMPALGITTDETRVAHAYQTMDPAEFRRAMLNIQDQSSATVPIPAPVWASVQDPHAAPTTGLVLGVEAAIDRSAASIIAADTAGHVELVNYDDGTAWVTSRVVDLVNRHNCRVVVDPRGPARSFITELAVAGVTVEELTSSEVAGAALTFVDRAADRALRVRPHPNFDLAVEAARRRWSGDQWYWTRKDTTSDVSPLVAASLAVFAAQVPAEPEPKPPELIVL